IHPRIGLMREAAEEIKSILKEHGVADQPVGVDVVEPAMLFELQEVGLKVRDGQQVMLYARELKSADEISLLNMSASLVDGCYQTIAEHLKPGIRENEVVALANKRLYELGSDDVGDQRDLGRALQPASAQFHRPADPAGRSGLLRHHPELQRLSHLLLPDLQCRPRHAGAEGRL